jgi:hypothetical protein
MILPVNTAHARPHQSSGMTVIGIRKVRLGRFIELRLIELTDQLLKLYDVTTVTRFADWDFKRGYRKVSVRLSDGV